MFAKANVSSGRQNRLAESLLELVKNTRKCNRFSMKKSAETPGIRIPDYDDFTGGKAARVDDYFSKLLAPEHSGLSQALRDNSAANMPTHDVSASQGKFLHLLVKLAGAKRILEIGTLGGYSTIWMADALLPDGTIDTIEINPTFAETARANIERAGHTHRVRIHLGKALDLLPELEGPYDLIFIDADKPNNPAYLEWSLKLSRSGTLIIGDNVVRGGEVVNPSSPDERVQGVRAFLDEISTNPRLNATALQTTGEKGWDGFVMAIVEK